MVPVLELRGAIPIGVAHGLDYRAAIAVSIVGNLVPVPFIVLFIRKIFAWLRTKSERLNAFVTRMEQRALKKSDTVRRARFWGLFLFVAIPLPGTGAWTGSLIAAMLEMRVREAFPPIALGVVTAGIIVAVVTYGAASLLFQLRRRLLCRASSREITAHCGTQKNPAVRWDSGIFYASLYSANAFSSASSSSRSSCGSLSPNCSKYSRMPAQFSRQLPASSVSS